eukprot:TRINITY_DN36654_c0_g1_i1.p1 TRINITY_DN36654_c0_g1~~TRINITY_DN36654_c0_g1_i1.p1  ORF type:complete len:419 (-),score=98.86 TRINITY_DN36654_c0_g1_i1:161-1345(-)
MAVSGYPESRPAAPWPEVQSGQAATRGGSWASAAEAAATAAPAAPWPAEQQGKDLLHMLQKPKVANEVFDASAASADLMNLLNPAAAKNKTASATLMSLLKPAAEVQAPTLPSAQTAPSTAGGPASTATNSTYSVMNPLSIRFSQPRINPWFQDHSSFEDALAATSRQPARVTSEGGASEECCLLKAPFPPIEVVSWRPKLRYANGTALKDESTGGMVLGEEKWFTMDNRRLYCLQRAAVEASPQICCAEVKVLSGVSAERKILCKFRTVTEGTAISVAHAKDVTNDGLWDWQQQLRANANINGFRIEHILEDVERGAVCSRPSECALVEPATSKKEERSWSQQHQSTPCQGSAQQWSTSHWHGYASGDQWKASPGGAGYHSHAGRKWNHRGKT